MYKIILIFKTLDSQVQHMLSQHVFMTYLIKLNKAAIRVL